MLPIIHFIFFNSIVQWKNLYLRLILLRDCSYYYEDRSLRSIKPENKIQKNNIYRFERHGVTFYLKNENVIFIIMGAMNPKLGEIIIINDNNDFPKKIRLISIFGKNMAYKHMPFCDTCCLLYITFFSIPSYSGKN